LAVYSGTKGALDRLTCAFAAELGPPCIRVNTLVPGGTHCGMDRKRGLHRRPVEDEMVSRTPLARLGQPSDRAKAVAILASDDALWITGDRIVALPGSYG